MSSRALTAIMTLSSSSLSEDERPTLLFPVELRVSFGDEGPDEDVDGARSLLIAGDVGGGLQSSARVSLLVVGG